MDAMALVQLDNGVKVLPRFIITHQDTHHTYVVIGGAAAQWMEEVFHV